ncbi:MAG: hypothetical protein HRU77_01525 [Gammaproteobacteria bacterium]|nr:MAG: hypothetical protein HRU77_01525 [Gammaproteobacteria bacterium]
MADGFSVLSNYQVNSAPAKLLLDLGDLGNGVDFAPVSHTAGSLKDFESHITGTGSIGGVAFPSAIADNFGPHAELFSQILTSQNLYLDSEGGTPKLSSYSYNTIAEISGGTADADNLLIEFAEKGISPYALTIHIDNDGGTSANGRPQSPLIMVNGRGYYASQVQDIPRFYYVGYIKLDADLGAKLAYPSNNWMNPAIEFKTNGAYDSANGIYQYGWGDLRLITELFKDSGGNLYLSLKMDSNANHPTLPLITYWQEYTAPYPSASAVAYSPQIGTWLKIEIEHIRAANYDDLTSGRTWMAVTDMATMVRTKIIDKIGGRHMGALNLPIGRFIVQSVYSASSFQRITTAAGHRIWNKCPFIQA